MKKTLYYSVQNGGDGSAYPKWFETMELANWHQEHEDEGWGECCTGSITVESNSVMVCDELLSAEQFYLELIGEFYPQHEAHTDPDIKAYVKKFFPDGIPFFIVAVKDESHYEVILRGKTIDTMYGHVGPLEKRGYGYEPDKMRPSIGTSREDACIQQDIINDISMKLSKIIV